MRDLGFDPDVEADPHDINGLVEAICRYESGTSAR